MRKKLLLVLLAVISTICMAFAFGSCDDTTTSKNDGWGNVFTVQTAYAHAQELGYEGTLEEFLASIQGKDGKDAVGIKTVVVDNQGDLIITLTDDTIINAGSVTNLENNPSTPTEYYTEGLHYMLNPDKQSYSVAGLGMAEDCDVVIPAMYKGKPVTRIANSAFYDCSKLQTVTFGDNSQLTSIGEDAFYHCSSLTSITIPDKVTSIGEEAFYACSNLQTVTFGDNSQLTSIGSYAFLYCSSLTSITIPDGVTSIGDYAFYKCSNLTSITIPDSVTFIGRYAFEDCSSLTSVTFENTSGWYVSSSSTATSGTSVTVTDTAQNATYLKSTYYNYYWKRNG